MNFRLGVTRDPLHMHDVWEDDRMTDVTHGADWSIQSQKSIFSVFKGCCQSAVRPRLFGGKTAS